MKKVKYISLAALCAIAAISLAFKDDLFLVSKNLDIFASLYKQIHVNYVDDTNPTSLMKNGVDAMLKNLDPYTEYVPENEIEDYKLKYVSTQYGGIGAATLTIDGKLFVNEVTAGNPAHKNDVRPGDQILKINDIAIAGKQRTQISQLLRGPKGSTVNLQIQRDGATITKSIVRDEIKQPNVSYSGMVNGKYGYIKLDRFLENAGQEVKDALTDLEKQKPAGLILDLRNNGGGILQEAVKIVNLFVPKGLLVVTQKGRNPDKNATYNTVVNPQAESIPLVVLINGTSASASEIVAGALQDFDRAVVIGQRSFGKGLVQQTFNLPYNSLLKVTVAKYYTPSGRCIQALDYAHRNNAGVAEKFADSTQKAFSTKAGRTVYDGDGVYPDLTTPAEKYNPITIALINNSLFFDYANSYKKQNSTVANAATFKLTDADYAAFVSSLAKKNYTYELRTERLLAELKKQAEADDKLPLLKADIDALNAKVAAAKKNDLVTHKTEIKRVLETQIISRYFLEKGKVEQAFQYDVALTQATTLFTQQAKLNAILKGEGEYKTIGKPLAKAK